MAPGVGPRKMTGDLPNPTNFRENLHYLLS